MAAKYNCSRPAMQEMKNYKRRGIRIPHSDTPLIIIHFLPLFSKISI